MLHGHGDEIIDSKAIIANFSSNIPPNINSDLLHQHLVKKIAGIGHYPDSDASLLAAKLASHLEVSVNSVLVTNGATEAFYLIAAQYARKRSLIFTPSFSEYEDACLLYQHKTTFLPYDDIEGVEPMGYDLIWLCNPNNPDGRVLDLRLIRRWMSEAPNTILVLDEAYINLISGVESLLKEVANFPNLVVVRSMTKRYVMPGLRLGYMVADHNRLSAIRSQLMPWRINYLAIEAGLFITSGENSGTFDADKLYNESLAFQHQIDAIDGFSVVPSKTNYFLVNSDKPAIELKKWLFHTAGILIRDASNFRGLNSHWFRLATQTEEHNKLLIIKLNEWSLM